MVTITLSDWAGLQLSKTEMTEQELGYNGDVARLERMAQNVARDKTASVKIEQDGKVLVTATYLNELV
jgi:hypothetical protein